MTGLPGKPPSHLLSQLFWAGVVTIGSMWRRLIRPYRQPPLCFALLVDPQMSLQSKRSLGSFLLTLPPLCRTDTQPHHVIQVEPGQHQALCEDGSGTSSQCLRSFSASAFRWDVVEFECAVVVISLFLLD